MFKVGETLAFDGYRKIVEKVFEDGAGSRKSFQVKAEADSVSVLAITRDNEVILAKQFRPGPEAVLFELPGGYIDQGETAEAAAARELYEETGFRGRLVRVGNNYVCAYSTRMKHYFLCLDCERGDAVGESGVQVVLVKFESFKEHVLDELRTDGDCALACLWKLEHR